jgi:hypothetical protein
MYSNYVVELSKLSNFIRIVNSKVCPQLTIALICLLQVDIALICLLQVAIALICLLQVAIALICLLQVAIALICLLQVAIDLICLLPFGYSCKYVCICLYLSLCHVIWL